ncbi:chaperone NapD [Ferrimonas balearica]|uniref:chaperone NapD n=1 Tax=Ferrimonas balearica TaxID=44012 RepID=UPI001C999EA8|nr:chaperone NapD [Ferrimonas balearica]MBY5993286.1 chaperone NapD [Ferrimonas balearica]
MERNYHVSSLVVHCRPQQVDAVAQAIAAHPGAEVPTRQDAKLVVVLEATDGQAVLDLVDAIRALEGVLSTALVYQQVEPMTEEQWI